MSFLDHITSIFNPKPPTDNVSGKTGKHKHEERSRNQLIIDEILFAFEESVEKHSTKRSLMFDTSYVAYVPEKYYNDLRMHFGIVTKEIVEELHDRLNEILAKNPKKKFAPLYNSWSFDIIPLGKDCSIPLNPDDPESEVTFDELDEKFVAVRSSAIPEELFNFSTSESDSIQTNRSQPNSVVAQFQVLSLEVIRGLKPGGTGYMYPIDLNSGEVTGTAVARKDANKALAVLGAANFDIKFIDKSGNRYPSIDIKVNNFFVGGPSAGDIYQQRPVVRLSSEEVMSPHFEVKREEDGAFYIRPIGTVVLNGLQIKRNEWSRLSDRNTSIKINGNIELTFNKK
ncbi:MAG: hypothetical protein NC402_05085 [Prevotella sp.]|nr:hypothetical protein [Prevotella sp.]MCM1074125.1 hypothetical protein [Ruminococcus sp.]